MSYQTPSLAVGGTFSGWSDISRMKVYKIINERLKGDADG